jgi:hypothetical protein
MQRRTFSRLAAPLAALALSAGFAAPALAQRGQDDAGNQGGATSKQATPRKHQANQANTEPTRPKQEAAKEHHQERRQANAEPGVRPYQMRAGHLREQLSNGGRGRELSNDMVGEVNINRDRMARLQRLRRIYEARKDERQLRRLDQLEQEEMRRYQGLMGQARSKLSDEEYRQFLAHVGDPRLENQIQEHRIQEARKDEARKDQPEERP